MSNNPFKVTPQQPKTKPKLAEQQSGIPTNKSTVENKKSSESRAKETKTKEDLFKEKIKRLKEKRKIRNANLKLKGKLIEEKEEPEFFDLSPRSEYENEFLKREGKAIKASNDLCNRLGITSDNQTYLPSPNMVNTETNESREKALATGVPYYRNRQENPRALAVG